MKDAITIKQINKETFNSFKKVRDLSSSLLGQYQLYSKNGLKYMGKQLPKQYCLQTYRNNQYPILKYKQKEEDTYLFSLHGQPLSNFGHKSSQEGQIKRWVQRHGSVEMCLWQLIKFFLRLIEEHKVTEILCECLRIHNGDIEYCYDSWMNMSHLIVLENQNQLEKYYFSQEDLDFIRGINDNPGQWSKQVFRPSKKSLYFRVFMLVLHLGSSNLNDRNYEYGLYKLNKDHISIRLDFFCSRYNSKGLGELTRKVIESQPYQMEELWKICLPEICDRKSIKSRSSASMSNRVVKLSRKNFKTGKETDQNASQKGKLNTSFASDISMKSLDQDSFIFLQKGSLSQKKPHLKVKDQNKQSKNTTFDQQSSTKKENSSVMSKAKPKLYKIGSSKKKQLNLKQLLMEAEELPKSCMKIVKYLYLQEFVPQNIYQEKILEVLDSVHIKNNWVKEQYENGSIYLGEIVKNKKQGKGMYLFNSHDFYFGDWSNDFMHGYGKYVFASGEHYEGEIKKGYKDGHGKCIYEDGKEYEGSWSKNCKIGLGKVKFPNEVMFIGLFKPDCNQTQGLFIGPIGEDNQPIWENKGILEHYRWQKNMIVEGKTKQESIVEKKGKLKSCMSQYYSEHQQNDGSSYQGEMLDGKKEGFGIQQSQNQRYEGEWHQGKREGQGVLYVKNLFTISGKWKGNLMVEYNFDENESYPL